MGGAMKTKPVGVRLTPALEQKLREFCSLAQRGRSAILRAVLASATPDSLPRCWLAVTPEERERLREIEG
jgi:hypothetical protein